MYGFILQKTVNILDYASLGQLFSKHVHNFTQSFQKPDTEKIT